jgi:hypothetical protein
MIGAGRFEGVLLRADRMRGIFGVGENYDTITFNRTGNTLSIDRKVNR